MLDHTSPELFEVPHSDETRLSTIHNIVVEQCNGDAPDVLYSMSGGIGKAGPHKDVDFRSLAYSSLSEHGIATGGRTRVIATTEMAKAFPDMQIVTNSYNRFDPDEPTMAAVIKHELIGRGVDESRISEETRSFSTITQLVEMINDLTQISQNTPDSLPKTVAVMTNEYHLPRMKRMYELLDTIVDDEEFRQTLALFQGLDINIHFVTAESIMRAKHPLLVKYLAAVAASPQFERTLESEQNGLRDLNAGKYKVVLQPERPR